MTVSWSPACASVWKAMWAVTAAMKGVKLEDQCLITEDGYEHIVVDIRYDSQDDGEGGRLICMTI